MSQDSAAAARPGRRRSLLAASRWPLVLVIGTCATLPSAAGAAGRTVNYSIARRGTVNFDMGAFVRIVDATLNDPRGWSLGGNVRFRRVARSSIRVTLAAPGIVGSFAGCSSHYSCRAGSYVLINADRWARGTRTYPGNPCCTPTASSSSITRLVTRSASDMRSALAPACSRP